jgi:hypothetical protein
MVLRENESLFEIRLSHIDATLMLHQRTKQLWDIQTFSNPDAEIADFTNSDLVKQQQVGMHECRNGMSDDHEHQQR